MSEAKKTERGQVPNAEFGSDEARELRNNGWTLCVVWMSPDRREFLPRDKAVARLRAKAAAPPEKHDVRDES